jgi:hypothetical protein
MLAAQVQGPTHLGTLEVVGRLQGGGVDDHAHKVLLGLQAGARSADPGHTVTPLS